MRRYYSGIFLIGLIALNGCAAFNRSAFNATQEEWKIQQSRPGEFVLCEVNHCQKPSLKHLEISTSVPSPLIEPNHVKSIVITKKPNTQLKAYKGKRQKRVRFIPHPSNRRKPCHQ